MFKKVSVALLLLSSFFLNVDNIYAKKTLDDANSSLQTFSQKTGIEEASIANMSSNVVTMIFAFAGLVFFALMVYAGIRWMTARDKAEIVDKARNTMIAATIGLIIIVAAYAVTNLHG